MSVLLHIAYDVVYAEFVLNIMYVFLIRVKNVIGFLQAQTVKFTVRDVFFNKLDAFMALRFTATGASPAAERTRILPMTQHADKVRNEVNFLPLFTEHRRC
jgi:hypothetical protein